MTPTEVSSFLPLKPDVFEILLALEAGDRHGYAILKILEGRDVHLAASLLYRKLRRLMDDGWVTEAPGRPEPTADDARRRYYRLTPDGHAVARAEAARILGLARTPVIRRLAASAGGEGV